MTLGLPEFQSAAETLGLRLTQGGGVWPTLALSGAVEGQPITIRQWRGDFVWVEFDALFAPAADLHLSITHAGVVSKLAGLFGKHDIEVGDPDFDAAFEIRAHEPERGRALLTPAVCEALFPFRNAGDLFRIDDEGVHLSVRPGSYSTLDARAVVRNARATASLARVISGAFAGVPPSAVLAPHVEAWRAFAASHGLDFSASPLRIAGTLAKSEYRAAGALPFVARVAPVSKDAYGVELRVRIDPPLPFHLRVQPAHWYDFVERTGDAAHTKIGDPSFDDALRVTTDDPEAARRLLGEEARRALLALHHAHAGIVLESHELSVRTKRMIEPSDFAAIVEHAADAARALHRI